MNNKTEHKTDHKTADKAKHKIVDKTEHNTQYNTHVWRSMLCCSVLDIVSAPSGLKSALVVLLV